MFIYIIYEDIILTRKFPKQIVLLMVMLSYLIDVMQQSVDDSSRLTWCQEFNDHL